jgi:ubiquinone/menaquinone biosynthesis C-methylase UbiE
MGFHTFDVDGADRLEDPTRYAYLSVDELLALFDPGPADRVADLGSGTGFYTDDVAPSAGTVYAVDVQAEMHEFYRDKGVPEAVELVTAAVEDLPFPDDHLDAAVSTMTFHEFATPSALAEVARVLTPGGRLAIADWTATGRGEDGPPLSERFDAAAAAAMLADAGFEVDSVDDRRETFVLRARSAGGSE